MEISPPLLDNDYNFIFLADSLPEKFPSFYKRITRLLSKNNLPYGFVPGTKDIWVRDFMPVQVQPGKYVQFRYEPDYLTGE
jgi:agmatine deiminase